MQDFERRTRDFQARLADAGIDLAVLADADAIAYLAGYWGYLGLEFGRPTLLIVPAAGEPTLITPLMESEMAGNMTWVGDVRPWSDGEDDEWRGRLRQCLDGHGGRALGLETRTLAPVLRAALGDIVPEAPVCDVEPILARLRMVKTPEEIAVMRQAGQVAVAMVEGAREVIAEGVPEYEVALAVIDAGTRKAAALLDGDEVARFVSPTIHNLQVLQSGHDTCMVHRRASTRRLRRGDPIYLCFCGIANYRNYKLGFDREFFVGEAGDHRARVYETAVRAQQAALAAIRPGAIAEAVHAEAEAVYREAGFAPGYRTGRAIGYSFLESPELKRGDRTPLEAGMTFAVDGGITIPGDFGARIGDSIVVTDDGFAYLTPYPRELTVL